MAAGHGGKRKNSGRKSNNELAEFRALIDQAVSDKDWLEILRAAKKEAKTTGRGAALAREWLSKYRFGLPTQIIAGDPDAAPIQFIEVAREARRGRGGVVRATMTTKTRDDEEE